MTGVLPPTRDLPPGRQARIRADLERAVAGRGSVRRYLVPVLAGATAVTAVVTSVVLLQPDQGPDPQPAVHVTTDPEPAQRETFGLTPEQIAQIEQGCAEDAKVPDKATLSNYGADEAGRWALLYTAKAAVWCDIGRGGEEYEASGGPGGLHVDWLAGNYSTHVGGVRPGGDSHPFKPALAGTAGYRIRAGRVDSSVARMTWTASDGGTAEAKIANGTFVLRMLYPSTWDGGGDANFSTERRAFDAAGNLLDPDSDGEGKCWVVPGTNEAIPDYRPVDVAESDGRKCQPAKPWK
ncbi:hypothetical protein BBK82_25995 [Lentzea guizhouensis]|uniref:Uncharacterized protein n=1 Tax=Lentzea guizhouensis TaxID=1586287 RepID=A0A1B2HMR2_9PSEU|nr:hypothetical protein [Lentzea guizhouensis]ANZ39009.1 hypothetical protein BBK82_25995 [Lentzea guizhouensis]